MTFILPTPTDFGFDATVRGHGWFNLEPFRYDANRVLRVAIEVGDSVPGTELRAVLLRLDEPAQGTLRVRVEGKAPRDAIEARVRSMLQLDHDLGPLHRALARDPAKYAWVRARGAGRLLRSATVFEDAVKVLLTTNCPWTVTRGMVQRLVLALGTPAPGGMQAFPGPGRLAREPLRFFRDHVRAGYRAQALLELAQAATSGALAIDRWRDPGRPTADLRAEILGLRGFGPYAADQLLRLAGRFDHPTLDSAMRAKWRHLHPRSKLSDTAILKRYATRFGALSGLVLWLDLTRDWHEASDVPAWP